MRNQVEVKAQSGESGATSRSPRPAPEHPAVKIWRDTMRLNTSPGFKQDIELTVGPDGEAGLKLWKSVLEGWWYYRIRPDGSRQKVPRNPLAIKQQLDAYEAIIRKD